MVLPCKELCTWANVLWKSFRPLAFALLSLYSISFLFVFMSGSINDNREKSSIKIFCNLQALQHLQVWNCVDTARVSFSGVIFVSVHSKILNLLLLAMQIHVNTF